MAASHGRNISRPGGASLNARALLSHLRTRLVAVTAALLGVALSRPVPPELARQMDEAAAMVERGR